MIGKQYYLGLLFQFLYFTSVSGLQIHVIPSIQQNLHKDLLTEILLNLQNTKRTFLLPSIEKFREYYDSTPESHDTIKQLLSSG